MKNVILMVFSFLFIQGCSVKYTVEPASEIASYAQEICVVENPEIKPEFLDAYIPLLEGKGFTVRKLTANSSLDSCSILSTYAGKWSWDFKTYMSFAEIKIYKDGVEVGKAIYQAPTGGMAMTTKIYEETKVKVKGLVDQLFPNA